MAKTIKQRLISICCYAHEDIDDVENTAMFRGIVEDWDVATEALRCVKSDLRRAVIIGYTMHEMSATMETIQAALARMEGNSPSRDEAMVEDKKYERDDIYKK